MLSLYLLTWKWLVRIATTMAWWRRGLKSGFSNQKLKIQCEVDWCISGASQKTRLMGPTWGPSGSCRPQMGPMLAPWNLLSGLYQFLSLIFESIAKLMHFKQLCFIGYLELCEDMGPSYLILYMWKGVQKWPYSMKIWWSLQNTILYRPHQRNLWATSFVLPFFNHIFIWLFRITLSNKQVAQTWMINHNLQSLCD